jgi:hypothetical protein
MDRKIQEHARGHGGPKYVQTYSKGAIMETPRTCDPKTSTLAQRRQTAHRRPKSSNRNHLRTQDRYPPAISAKRNGLRLRHELLKASERLAKSWCMGQNTPDSSQKSSREEQDRLFPCNCRFGSSASYFLGG